MNNYEKMWHAIQSEIVDIASDRYSEDMPEINLIAAVLIQAGKDHDYAYFKSFKFEHHCFLLNINKDYAIIFVKRAWELEKSGVEWVETMPLDEEWDC